VFDDIQLDRQLQLGVDALAFSKPTAVQALSIPIALKGGDMMVCAETGSGKTLAYLVPLAQRILTTEQTRSGGTLALVLVPTRELARQVLKHCRQLLKKSPLRVEAITGGEEFRYQRAALRKDPEILVATPGRMLEHCKRGSADLGILQTLVLDEADRMLDLGLREDVLAIAASTPSSPQTLLYSATLTHRGVKEMADTLLKHPETVSTGKERAAHDNIVHQLIMADSQTHKNALLLRLLQQGDYTRALVFGNKRTTAARLADLAGAQSLRCACLHGEMTTEERKLVVQRFHNGKINVLCASDVAARGLDVSGIEVVINYDIPHSGDDYVHRTGRTGRAGASGMAISLASAAEWKQVQSIQRYLSLDFESLSLPGLKARFNGTHAPSASDTPHTDEQRKTIRAENKSSANSPPDKSSGRARRRATPVENDGFSPLKKKPGK